jgi:hypothetical protein
MRRTEKAILLGLLVILATGARADEPYVNHQYQFGFTPPYGWWRKTLPDALIIYMEPEPMRPAVARLRPESNEQFIARLKENLKAPVNTETRLRANLTVTARPSDNLTLDQYAREARAKAAKMKVYRILGEKTRRLGGAPAMEHLIRIAVPGQPVVQTREVFCIHNGRVITLTLAAPPANFAKYSTLFDKTLASFVWRQ